MISGIMMAITEHDKSSNTGYKTITAATLPAITTFPNIVNNESLDLSEDLVRDLAKKKGVLDTVYITKTDTIKEQVTKVKVKKVPVPSNVMEINVSPTRIDTVKVPVYYIATQVGMKEGPKDKCVSVYEVHEVDKICPETNNSSIMPTNTLDNDVGTASN